MNACKLVLHCRYATFRQFALRLPRSSTIAFCHFSVSQQNDGVLEVR
jgi:hypothetical protein